MTGAFHPGINLCSGNGIRGVCHNPDTRDVSRWHLADILPNAV